MASMTTNEQRLEKQIESAIQEYMRASRATALAAIERTFAAASNVPAERAKPLTRVRGAASGGQRRTASELAALGEQLYEIIAAHPGEGMVALSERIGVSGPLLQRVVARLRSGARIRTVGARVQMRYFPKV